MASPRCVIDLVFPGRTACVYLKQGEDDYLRRLSRFADISLKPVRAGRSSDGSDASVVRAEARELLKKIIPGHQVIALDLRGRALNSGEFASLLGQAREGGRGITFLLGGHLGLGEEVIKRADTILAISRMTFTHEMARIFLLEQVYRGYNILTGSDYHK